MALSSLPSELILHMASCLKYDGDINALMQTNHRFYRLLSPYLHRHNIQHSEASALRWAALNGAVSTLEKVLEAGASSDHPFYSIRCEHTRGIWQDWGPMVLAAKSGHEAVVMFLLEKGANPDPEGWVCPMNVQEDEDEYGGKHTKANPLFWSLAHGQESTLRILVTHAMKSSKADQEFAKFYEENLRAMVNKTALTASGISLTTPLHEAVRHNSLPTVRFLLRTGANPNLTDTNGAFPLAHAASWNHVEVARLLLENGALPLRGPTDSRNLDTLQFIRDEAIAEHFEVAKLLLHHIQIEDLMVGDALVRDLLLITATMCGNTTAVQQILNRATHRDTRPWGSRIFLHSERLSPPLAEAAGGGHKDIVQLFLDYGADLWPESSALDKCQYPEGRPLLMAAAKGQTEIAKIFIDKASSLGKPYHDRRLSVCTCDSAVKFPPILQLLLEEGLLRRPETGASSEMMVQAVTSGKVASVQLLLEHGFSLPEEVVSHAAAGGQNMFRYLLTRGAIPSFADSKTDSMLLLGLSEFNPAMVEHVLEQGCDPRPLITKKALQSMRLDSDWPECLIQIIDIVSRHGVGIDQLTDFFSLLIMRDGRRLTQSLLDRGANPLPESSKWARQTLSIATFVDDINTLRIMLQAICSREDSLEGLKQAQRLVEKEVARVFGNWKLTKLVEDIYWRQKYPVP